MPVAEPLIAPLAALIERLVPDKPAREKARRELAPTEGSQDLQAIAARLSAIVAEAGSPDRWTSRARPTFLYVMYAMLLWAIPMGLVAAVSPATAHAISTGMTAYLNALPEALYALFGTGYLGYTAARQWGMAKRAER